MPARLHFPDVPAVSTTTKQEFKVYYTGDGVKGSSGVRCVRTEQGFVYECAEAGRPAALYRGAAGVAAAKLRERSRPRRAATFTAHLRRIDRFGPWPGPIRSTTTIIGIALTRTVVRRARPDDFFAM